MSNDYFSIGFDSDYNKKRAVVQKFQPSTMDNDMAMPCDICDLAAACEANSTECSAFRNWSAYGVFKDTDVQRYVRAMK